MIREQQSRLQAANCDIIRSTQSICTKVEGLSSYIDRILSSLGPVPPPNAPFQSMDSLHAKLEDLGDIIVSKLDALDASSFQHATQASTLGQQLNSRHEFFRAASRQKITAVPVEPRPNFMAAAEMSIGIPQENDRGSTTISVRPALPTMAITRDTSIGELYVCIATGITSF